MFGEFSPKLPVAQISKTATNSIAYLTANQTLTGSYVDLGGCSISIDTGTWFIMGTVTLLNTSANDARVKIYYGTTNLVSSRMSQNSGYAGTISLHCIATILGPQTLKMAGIQIGGSWTVYKSDSIPSNIPGTYLTAVRIG